ncbi:uncharacterized protein LOC129762331 [Toxorhynchites rutilus septentrionalis]|uniref:uncharacterized protein LOC129762331 n=1 Tax=Toxorhynchites rutilus septentrionalis TaxID=329112 RepID=UPI002479C2AA|nr:uncharacterized protein LOC129762331 [Toxorhynchites rutilus septentrionalis]
MNSNLFFYFRIWTAVRTLLFLVLVSGTMGRQPTIQIMELSHNPGLLAIASGKNYIKDGEHKIYHIIDFEIYHPTLITIKNMIDGIKNICNTSELNEIILSKFNNLNYLYHSLQNKPRPKRGLLNFVGSGIKFITGNLDNEDYNEIIKDLEELRIKGNQLINENNKQAKINYQLNNRIDTIIKQINKQQEIIVKNFNQARMDNTAKQIQIIKDVMKINMLLDNLISHFKDIAESIHLAKFNIISKHILHPEELLFSIERLEEKGIEIKNIEQAYDFLEISAFFNSSELIFVVKIPSLQNVTYSNLILETLPVRNKILNIPANKAMTSEIGTYFITRECQQIEQNNICNEDMLLNYSDDKCFSKILRGFTGNCTFEKYERKNEIKLLTDHHVVLKSMIPLEIKTNCGITDRNLSGLFLVNKTTFTNTEIIRNEIPIILPFDGLKIEVQITQNQTAIEDLHIINRNHLDSLVESYKIHHYSSMSLSIVSILGVIIMIVLYLIKSKSINIRILGKPQPHESFLDRLPKPAENPITASEEAKSSLVSRDVSFLPKGEVIARSTSYRQAHIIKPATIPTA